MSGGKEEAYAAVYGAGSEGNSGRACKPVVYCCYPSAAYFSFAGYVHEFVWLRGAIPVDMLAQEDGLRRRELALNAEEILNDDVAVMLKCDRLWVFGDYVTTGMEHEMHAWYRRHDKYGMRRFSWQDIGVSQRAIEYFHKTMRKGVNNAKAQD